MFILLSLLLFLSLVSSSDQSCVPKVDLKCKHDVTKQFTYYVYQKHADIEPGCNGNKITNIQWSLGSKTFSGAANKRMLTLPKRVVPPGTYTLKALVTETGGGTTTATCTIYYVSEPPVLMFEYGHSQYVKDLVRYTVDLRRSRTYDYTLPPVKWSAKCKRAKDLVPAVKNVCNKKECVVPSMKGTVFQAYASACFDVTVFTATVMHDNHEISHDHYIYARFLTKLDCVITIVCEKNCDYSGSSLSTPTLPIVLKLQVQTPVFCANHAKWLPEAEWVIIKRGGLQLTEGFTLLNKNSRIRFDPENLEYSDEFLVSAEKDGKFKAHFKVRTVPLVGKPQCTIRPDNGISLETVFTINCVSDDKYLDLYGPYYSIYQEIDGKKNLLINSADEDIEIVVAAIKGQPQQQLVIEGHSLFFNQFECETNAITVTEKEVNEEKIKEVLDKMSKAFDAGDPLALQYVGGLLNELKASDLNKKSVRNSQIKIMQGLRNYKIETLDTYQQISGLMHNLIENEDKTEKYKKNLAILCKKVSAVHVAQLHKSLYVKYQENQAKIDARNDAQCADKLLEDSIEDEDENASKPEPVKESVVVEDYPDYKIPFKNPKVEETKQAGVEVIRQSGRAIATTLNAGEEYVQESKKSQTLIAKEEGQYMGDKRMEIGSMTLIPNADFMQAQSNQVITAIISDYDRDVLTPQSGLSANIADISFFKDAEKLHNVTYNVEFKVLESSVEFEEFSVVPPQAGSKWVEIDKKMNVHRLNLYAMETCMIRFKIEEDVVLNVALTVNQRANKKHFEDKTSHYIVDGKDPDTWAIQNPYPRMQRDCLYYVAVIPHPSMIQDDFNTENYNVTYKLQLAEVSCVIYNQIKHRWAPSDTCEATVRATDNESIIACSCVKASLHSVFYKPIEHRLDIQQEINFIVYDFVNYIILAFVLIVLICYIIGLAFMLKRKQNIFGRDKIIFLSDNLKNDRYGYMLVVRTGCYSNAGTTANIMIQLFDGKGKKTKPHVLNYPDPACKLLQRDCVDWMILTHHEHLPSLQSIILWTDSIGMYPEWYCEDITIFDLQTKDQYLFKVRTWFSALEKHVHYIRIGVSEDNDMREQTTIKSISKHFRFHYGGQHAWNFFVRDDEDITFPERLTVILSMIYTTYTVAILLMGPPRLTRSDSFGYGRFQFYHEHATYSLACSIITSALHFPIVYIFRHSKQSTKSSAFVVTVKKFPYKVRTIVRLVLICWLCVCFFYLVMFGFWITYNSIHLWICITTLSLLISIIVWENLFIIILAIINSHKGIVVKLEYRFDQIIVEIERQRTILFRKFGEVLMRPYFKRHYRLLSPNEIFNLRQNLMTKIEVSSLFKDMCLFVAYIILLYLLVIIRSDDEITRCNRMMHLIVEESIYSGRRHKLQDIENIKAIYDYIEFVIIPAMHPHHWYGNWYSIDAGLMADFSTRILGVVQLRQQRRTQICRVPNMLRHLKIPCTNEAPVFEEWEYYNGSDITSSLGLLQIYDGSGYIARLGRTLKNSKFILDILRQNKWININTKVLFLEFLTYNANLNMFNAVRIIIERSATGKLLKSSQIFTISLIYTSIYMEVMVATLQILLTLVIFIMLTKRFVQIITDKRGYFKDFWNILDVILSILSIVIVSLFFHQKAETYRFLKKVVETDHNKFISYFYLVTLAEVTTITLALTLGLATLRLWKFLQFGILFKIMERTILKAGPQLAGTFFYQMIVYMMMAVFVYPLYGENLNYFRDFYTSLVTLYLASINFTEHLERIYMSMGMHPSYLYLVYSFFLLISLCFLNLYATTLMLNLEESRIFYSNTTMVYSIQNYVSDVFQFYREKLRRHLEYTRLKGGTNKGEQYEIDVDKLVYPKANVHRYADIIFMDKQKIELMANVAIAAIKNVRKYGRRDDLSENEFKLMAKIIISLYSKKPVNERDKFKFAHMFFKAKDVQKGTYKFVPDTKMLQMELVTKKLFEGKTEEIQIQDDDEDVVIHSLGDAQRLEYICKCMDLVKNTIEHIVIVEPEAKQKKHKE